MKVSYFNSQVYQNATKEKNGKQICMQNNTNPTILPKQQVNQISFGRKEAKIVYPILQGNTDLENLFQKGNDHARSILGGKGAGLYEMTAFEMPVPPAITATTDACLEYLGIDKNLPKSLEAKIQKDIKTGMTEEKARKTEVLKEVMTGIHENMKTIEEKIGSKFGDAETPLLVSVRSGAKISMPGMMDTVLNLGINDKTRTGVQKQLGEKVGLDCERRFLEMFGGVVLGIEKEKFTKELNQIKKENNVATDNLLEPKHLKQVIKAYEGIYNKEGLIIPTKLSVDEQLQKGVEAVFNSWNSKRAIDYREANNYPHDMGTAVNVQAMVYGNSLGGATAVITSRDISTGKNIISGDYLEEAQGEDVVNGSRPTHSISEMKKEMPEIYSQLEKISTTLEKNFKNAQDMELTIQVNPTTKKRELWMLQTRNAKRTGQAAVKIAYDMHQEKTISKKEALTQFDPNLLDQLLLPVFVPAAKKQAIEEKKLINDPKRAVSAAPGAASGVVALSSEKAKELAKKGLKVILVREETRPDDFDGMMASKGILTRSGGTSSHAALVARQFGKACVSSASDIVIDEKKGQITDAAGNAYKEGIDTISVDGSTAEVFKGEIATQDPDLDNNKEYQTLMGWADSVRTMKVKANADKPEEAARAIYHGAEGIGLCRTEHMFGAPRTPVVRDMILAAQDLKNAKQDLENVKDDKVKKAVIDAIITTSSEKLDGSLNSLGQWQKGDFKGIFKEMKNKPVTIRLIDPPLHEFLQSHEEIEKEIAELKDQKGQEKELEEKQKILTTLKDLHEANPMLGTRGCRLGIMIPGLIKMQSRAIAEAACEVQKETGIKVKPQIMIPLVAHTNELKDQRKVVEDEVKSVMKEKGVTDLDYKIGTMIELPRAAVTADEIAKDADFFSFGTNDLTQTTMGISRDDAEKGFLNEYIRKGIFPANPFKTIDKEGVGEIVKIGVDKGRQTKPNLDIGVCGEHGGDPASVEFFHNSGFDSVSCSPNRVPIARLAAAQAVIKEQNKEKK